MVLCPDHTGASVFWAVKTLFSASQFLVRTGWGQVGGPVWAAGLRAHGKMSSSHVQLDPQLLRLGGHSCPRMILCLLQGAGGRGGSLERQCAPYHGKQLTGWGISAAGEARDHSGVCQMLLGEVVKRAD